MVSTKIGYFLDGTPETQAKYVTIGKSLPEIRLSDLRSLYMGPEGVFLVKTPDNYNHHWSLVIDEHLPIPSCGQDQILAKVKPLNKGDTFVSYYIEGTYDPRSFVVCVDKPPTQVTLRDIKRTYLGNPGVFFFQEIDTTSGTHIWTMANNEDEVIPSVGGWVIGKIRLHPSNKFCVVAVHLEGHLHPLTLRIHKVPTEVTMADVRAYFTGPPGEFYVRSGNQFVSVPPDNTVLPSDKGLIQLKLRPYHTYAVNPTSTTTDSLVATHVSPMTVPQQGFEHLPYHAQFEQQEQQHVPQINFQATEEYISTLTALHQQQKWTNVGPAPR